MIDQIYWNYFEKGIHLIIMRSGREHKMTYAEMLTEFTLGHLTRRR
jgi:hypothetical protein